MEKQSTSNASQNSNKLQEQLQADEMLTPQRQLKEDPMQEDVVTDSSQSGRVLPPLLLWFVGVPGILCILLWLLVFRGH